MHTIDGGDGRPRTAPPGSTHDHPLPALDPAEHRVWSARHEDELAAAEAWLDDVLAERAAHRERAAVNASDTGAPGHGSVDEQRRDLAEAGGRGHEAAAGWSIEALPGGCAEMVHASTGARLSVALALRADERGARLRVARYSLDVPDTIDEPPAVPAIDDLETRANEPTTLQAIIDLLRDPPLPAVATMRLPAAMRAGRHRSDRFYEQVAMLVRACQNEHIAYGPRLALDNDVSEGTVRSWVHEARRRGHLPPAGRAASLRAT